MVLGFTILLFLVASVALADGVALPEAQPGDALYRKTSPGRAISWPSWSGMEPVALPKPKTKDEMIAELDKLGYSIEIDNRHIIAENGRRRLIKFLPFVLISAIATFALASYGLQFVGVAGFAVSISYVISGVIEIKMAENWAVSTWTVVGAAVVLVIGFGVFAFVLKDKGLGKPGILGEWLGRIRAKFSEKG